LLLVEVQGICWPGLVGRMMVMVMMMMFALRPG
jgi:hypothetical protein